MIPKITLCLWAYFSILLLLGDQIPLEATFLIDLFFQNLFFWQIFWLGLCVSWVSVSADSMANGSYRKLRTYLMLLDMRLHTVLIKSNEIFL